MSNTDSAYFIPLYKYIVKNNTDAIEIELIKEVIDNFKNIIILNLNIFDVSTICIKEYIKSFKILIKQIEHKVSG